MDAKKDWDKMAVIEKWSGNKSKTYRSAHYPPMESSHAPHLQLQAADQANALRPAAHCGTSQRRTYGRRRN
jgi:hypothetical protein